MIKKVLLGISILTLPACTTLMQADNDKQNETLKLSYSKNPIVQQTNGRNLMQTIARDRWIELRNSSKTQHVRIYAALGAGEWTVAISDARSYLATNPRDEVALTAMAIGLAMKRNYSLSAYYAELLEQYHPGNPEIHNLKGLAILQKAGVNFSDYQLAKAEFEQAFNASGQQVASGLNLAHLYLDMGNLEAAKETFLAVKPRCNNCSEASMGYGIALSRLRDFAKADKVFSDILEKERHHAHARYYAAMVAKVGRGDNQAAIEHLTALVDDSETQNLEMKRKANIFLRRIQAEVYGQAKPAVLAEKKPTKTAIKPEAELVIDSDLEQAINAE